MSVSKKSEADNMLVTFHESTQTVTPSMKTITVRWDMCNPNRTTIDCFKSLELILQPLNLIPRIVSVLKKFPIHVIAGLSVDTEDLGLWEDATILQLELSRIIAVLLEILQGLSVKPLSP